MSSTHAEPATVTTGSAAVTTPAPPRTPATPSTTSGPLSAPVAKSRRGARPHLLTAVRWLSPIVVVLLWQLASYWGLLPQRILPAPQLVLDAGWTLLKNGELGEALKVSTLRVVEGLLLGGIIGVALGVLVGLSRWADAIVDPNLQIVRALPHLGLTPLFILWFGIGELPKVLMVALGVAFPLYLNTVSAIRQVDPKLRETAKVLGFSPLQRFSTLILPSAAPQILVGLRQSLAIAWLTLIVAEQVNADSGIGYLIMNARDFQQIDVIIFGLIVYGLLGLFTDAIVRYLERRALRYRADS